MRKGLIFGLVALITIFMMTGCPNDPAPTPPKVYTVTFSADGWTGDAIPATLPDPVKVTSGKKVSDVKGFNAEDYAFLGTDDPAKRTKNGWVAREGWVVDNNVPFTTDLIIAKDYTVVPKGWQPTITLDLAGGTLSGVAAANLIGGNKVTAPVNSKLGDLFKTGGKLENARAAKTSATKYYTFKGWSVAPIAGVMIDEDSAQNIGMNRTIYAIYEESENFDDYLSVFTTGLNPASKVERAYLENNGHVVYKFDLSAIEYQEFVSLDVEYMLDDVQLGEDANQKGPRNGNMRAYGAFTTAALATGTAEKKFGPDNILSGGGTIDKSAQGIDVYQTFNLNDGNPFIISSQGGNNTFSDIDIDEAFVWKSFTYKIDGSEGLSGSWDEANLPADTFKGVLYFGVGITGAGNSGDSGDKSANQLAINKNGITQWIRNVRLTHSSTDRSKDVYGTIDIANAAFVCYVDPCAFQWRSGNYDGSEERAPYLGPVKLFDYWPATDLDEGEDPEVTTANTVVFKLTEATWFNDISDIGSETGDILKKSGSATITIESDGTITMAGLANDYSGIDVDPIAAGANVRAEKFDIKVVATGTEGEVFRLNQGASPYGNIGDEVAVDEDGDLILQGEIPAAFGNRIRICPGNGISNNTSLTITEITITAVGQYQDSMFE